MADRDPRLGPYGIYTRDKTEEAGLRAAMLATIRHLEFQRPQTKERALVIKDEIARLRSLLR